jgi:branched-chain amino acid transport system substrate-binding protein
MAVDEINTAGGVNVGGEMRPFEVVSIDTREHEAGIPVTDALAAVEQLILEEEPDAILVGAFRSEVLMASLDLIAEHKVPYITTIAMTPALQASIMENPDEYKYVFRNCLNAIYLVQYITQTVAFTGEEFGFNKAYIITQDVAWANGTGAGVAGWMEENGWEVVGNDAYPIARALHLTDQSLGGGAQLIIPSSTCQKPVCWSSRPDDGIRRSCWVVSPIASKSWEAFDGDVEGMVNFIFEVGPLPVQAVPNSVTFYNAFAAKYGEEAALGLSGHGPAPSYDSVYILKAAIERAGTLDPDALVEALEATDMDGAVGHITFGEDHQAIYGTDPAETSVGVAFQWVEPGVRVPVFPAFAAEGEIQLPEGTE